MEIGTVRQVDIEQEMKVAYLDYAMSVITSRALPDVRDGLKPVQRRILYAMNDMGLQHDKPYKKSARIVGEVLGKYHPHGDSAVYDAMARMAQYFTMRYMLVDGQGNFGSVDGDNPAAMRYTEARLAAVASEVLADIDKDTVDFSDNFDGTLREPRVLPSRLPNFLLNGASGIAVGMATNVPPHNLAEICDAVSFLIDHHKDVDSVSVEDLMAFVKGPDFPTGGIVLGLDGIRSAYATGNGYIPVRARTHTEEASGGKSLIIVTELPYQVAKAALIEKIAELVREKRIDTLSDLRDESDRQGMRIVIEMKRGVETGPTLNQLFKLTALQTTFNVNMLALVDGEPRVLSLKKALQLFVEHRQEVITRRSRFELEQAKHRAHILEGLKIALDHLDEVIATIRQSQTADTALTNLQRKFKLTEVQARAILDLQLRRLAALERRRIEEEYAEVLKRIKYLQDLLVSPRRILALIKSEMQELKDRFGDPRLTRIVDNQSGDLTAEDLMPSQCAWVVVSRQGVIRRLISASEVLTTATRGDPTALLTVTNAQNSVLFCTNRGRCFTQKVQHIPDAQAPSTLVARWLGLDAEERVVALLDIPDFGAEHFLTLCTQHGQIKRTSIKEFSAIRGGGLIAMSLDNSDEVCGALVTSGDQELLIVTSDGQALRFREDAIRAMGRSAAGVRAIKLNAGQRVISLCAVEPQASLLVITQKGYGKRTSLADYPAQGRATKGVGTFSPNLGTTGSLVGACVVHPGDEIGLISVSGACVRQKADLIPIRGRTTRGTAVIALRSSDSLETLARLPASREEQRSSPGSSEAKTSGSSTRAVGGSRGRKTGPKPSVKPAKTTATRSDGKSRPQASAPLPRKKRGEATDAEGTALNPPSQTRRKTGR